MEARLPLRLARLVWPLCLALACGDAPPPVPAAPPEEFDDPFADEADAKAADGALAAAAPAAPPAPAPVPADSPAPPADPAPPAAADGPAAPVPADSPAAPVPADSPAAAAPTAPPGKSGDAAPATKKKAAPARTASTPTPAPEPAAPPAPEPAPAPAPAPEPAPAPTPAPAPAPPPVPPQQRFAGTYKFSGGDAQRQNLEAAIEAAAQQLNALIRPIGRKRLRESNPIREQITIAVDGEKVTTTFAPGRTVAGVLGGPAVAWTSDSGKPVSVAFSMVKGRLVQTYTADDGGRRSVYTLDDSGDKLTLSVTITSERLTEPLKYALTYRRN